MSGRAVGSPNGVPGLPEQLVELGVSDVEVRGLEPSAKSGLQHCDGIARSPLSQQRARQLIARARVAGCRRDNGCAQRRDRSGVVATRNEQQAMHIMMKATIAS